MAIHSLPQIMTADYVPRSDRDSEVQTKFKLKPLNGLQHMEVLCEVILDKTSENFGHLNAKGLQLALKYGLAGWENFCDEAGQAVPYMQSNFAKIPPFILQELAIEISNRSVMEETAAKNS